MRIIPVWGVTIRENLALEPQGVEPWDMNYAFKIFLISGLVAWHVRRKTRRKGKTTFII